MSILALGWQKRKLLRKAERSSNYSTSFFFCIKILLL
jgi:hypothetical protein